MKHLDRIEEYIMLVTFPLMFVIILASTFTRYFGLLSIHWGEEAARYLMIWLGFAGTGYGFKKNAHLGLSFLVDMCPPGLKTLAVYLRAAAIVLFGALVTWFSFLIVHKQWLFKQISPSLHMPMWLVYAAMLFGGVLIVVRTVQCVVASHAAARAAAAAQPEGR